MQQCRAHGKKIFREYTAILLEISLIKVNFVFSMCLKIYVITNFILWIRFAAKRFKKVIQMDNIFVYYDYVFYILMSRRKWKKKKFYDINE